MFFKNVLIFLGFTTFLSILVGSFCFLFRQKVSRLVSEENLYQYQYFSLNPTNKKSSRGVISILRQFEPDEFISYEVENGNRILLSRIGLQEFICHGSCFCLEDSQERGRRSTSNVVRPVIYLVAAMSSGIAFLRAKSHFEDECGNIGDRDCSIIRSEVESCEEVSGKEELEYSENDEMFTREYSCFGRCSRKSFESQKERSIAESIECDEISLTNSVNIPIYPGSEGIPARVLNKARMKFLEDLMIPFCRKSSKEKNEDVEVCEATLFFVKCRHSDPCDEDGHLFPGWWV